MEKDTLGFLSPSRLKIIAFGGRAVFWRGFFAGHLSHNSFINKCVCGQMPSCVCWGIITYSQASTALRMLPASGRAAAGSL